MLTQSNVHANVPANDLQRARAFYTEKLGLTPSAEDEETITFPTPDGSWFQIYRTAFAGTGKHTIALWDVANLADTIAELRGLGVQFQHYDIPGMEWDGDMALVPGGKAAWFEDSEGNVMCLDERDAVGIG